MSEISDKVQERISKGECYTCGGQLSKTSGGLVCSFCGRKYLHVDKEMEPLLKQIAELRIVGRKFDDAYELSVAKIEEYPDCLELYWQAILAQFGVIYVSEPDGKKYPTFFRVKYSTKRDNIRNYRYYKELIARPSEDKKEYIDKAAELDEILNTLSGYVEKEEDYDVFISFKQSEQLETKGGNRTVKTDDFYKAEETYENLTKHGLKVFFSPVSIGQNKDAQGKVYEPKILRALQSCRVMLLFGSRTDYLTATWVENEWRRYKYYINIGERKPDSLIYLYCKDMPVLPADLTRMGTGNMQLNSVDYFRGDYQQELLERVMPFIKSKGIISASRIERKQVQKGSREVKATQLKGFVEKSVSDFGLGKNLRFVRDDMQAGYGTPSYKRALSSIKQYRESYPSSGEVVALELLGEFRLSKLDELPAVIFKKPQKTQKSDKEYWDVLFNKLTFIVDNADSENFYKSFINTMYDCVFKNIDNGLAVNIFNIIRNRKYMADGVDYRRENIAKVKDEARASLNYKLFSSAIEMMELPDETYKKEMKLYTRRAMKEHEFDAVKGLCNMLLKLDNSDTELIDMKNLAAQGCDGWEQFFSRTDAYAKFGDGQIFKEALGYLEYDNQIDAYLKGRMAPFLGGMTVKNQAQFIEAYDVVLGYYRSDEARREAVKAVVIAAEKAKCFKVALRYSELLITNTDNEYDARIYWNMTLYSFNTDQESDLYQSTEDIDKKSIYFNLAYQKSEGEFTEMLSRIRSRQMNTAEINRKKLAKVRRGKRNRTIFKTVASVLSVAVFAALLYLVAFGVSALCGNPLSTTLWYMLPDFFMDNDWSIALLIVAALALILGFLTLLTHSREDYLNRLRIKRKKRRLNPVAPIYVLCMYAILGCGLYFRASVTNLLILAAGATVLYILFFNYGSRLTNFGQRTGVILPLVSLLIFFGFCAYIYLESGSLLPNLGELNDMARLGLVEQSYYDSMVKSVNISMIINFVLFSVVMIGCFISSRARNIGVMGMPMFAVFALMLMLIIRNANVAIPANFVEASEISIGQTVILSAASAVPGIIIIVLAYYIHGHFHEYIGRRVVSYDPSKDSDIG